MSQPIVVEFVGMMGSGKSTITRLVLDELNRRGYQCPSQKKIVSWMAKSGFNNLPVSLGILQKLCYYSKFSYLISALQFPLVAFKAYHFALSVSPQNRNSWQASRSSMNWMGIFNKYIRNSPYDAVVLEEGAIQYTLQIPLFGEQYSDNAQKQLISSLLTNQNHLVVFLKIDAETAMKRIQGRAAASHQQGMLAWQFENETEDEQMRRASQAVNLFESLVKPLRELSPRSLIEVDTLKDPQENAALVVDSIERLVTEIESAEGTNLLNTFKLYFQGI
ncbi:MAG TPA: hypothetical protein V6D11_27635 [Waterburya sp.]|jgi:thymidylate kinase